ncbi:MAG: addiction module protein [Desulfobulbaceae bacterium A2]|nr:MAG: addiction module protein [Desulfobulbaceae bacterium A2]
MTTILERVEKEALNLPREERAFLADRLLSSLGGEVLSEVDAAWVAEAERRYAEYKEGGRQPVPADQVFADADRMLG